MSEYYAAENKKGSSDNKNKNDAKRALINFLEQLKIHFDFNDEDIINIIKSTLKTKESNNFIKKWWHIW